MKPYFVLDFVRCADRVDHGCHLLAVAQALKVRSHQTKTPGDIARGIFVGHQTLIDYAAISFRLLRQLSRPKDT